MRNEEAHHEDRRRTQEVRVLVEVGRLVLEELLQDDDEDEAERLADDEHQCARVLLGDWKGASARTAQERETSASLI